MKGLKRGLGPLLVAFTVTGAHGQAPDSGRTASGLWYAARGQGPALVLVHGSNLDSRSFDLMAGPLARGHRVLVTDLRFHGKSRDAGGPVSFGRDLLEVMDAAKLDRATLLGHSLGAQIVIDFALAHPERLERLIVVGPNVSGYVPSAMPAGFEPVVQALRAGDVAGAVAGLAAMPAMRLVSARERQPVVVRLFQDNAALFKVDPKRLVPAPSALDRLASLRMPVLILVGDSDLTESPKVADLLAQRVAGARLVRLPRCSHLAPLDCPDAVVREVAAFLRRE